MRNFVSFFLSFFLFFAIARADAENFPLDQNQIKRLAEMHAIAGNVGILDDEISDMRAWDYIEILKGHRSVVIFPVHVVIHDVEMTEFSETNGYDIPYFPLDVEGTIPYLLSVLDSKEPCARPTISLLSKLPAEPSTVGIEALRLLKAIKLKSYHPLKTTVNEAEKKELVEWAHKEMDAFEKLYGHKPALPQGL